MSEWYHQQPFRSARFSCLSSNQSTKLDEHLRFSRDEAIRMQFCQQVFTDESPVKHRFQGLINLRQGVSCDSSAKLQILWNDTEQWRFQGWLRMNTGGNCNIYLSQGLLTIIRNGQKVCEIMGEWHNKESPYVCSRGMVTLFEGKEIVETYSGQMKDGRFNGLGVLKFRVKDPNNQLNGFTTFFYRGSFLNNRFHGYGKLVMIKYVKGRYEETEYQGDWTNGDLRNVTDLSNALQNGFSTITTSGGSMHNFPIFCRILSERQ